MTAQVLQGIHCVACACDHFERRFAEANADYMARVLGSDVTADDVLNHARDDGAGGNGAGGPAAS